MKNAVLILISFFFITPALAQQPAPSTGSASSSSRKVKAGKTVYDFDEVDIMGNLKKPEVGVVVDQPEMRFRRLLDLDESFIPEIVRSVDEF